MKRAIKLSLLVAGSMAATSFAHAFDKEIVNQFSAQVSDLVCSDGGAWLSCYRVEPSTCKTVAAALVEPCANDIFLPIKEPLSYEAGVQAAQRLMGCFNEQFEQSYGANRVSTPDCSQPPKHLRASGN
jgi:hypothetical protein